MNLFTFLLIVALCIIVMKLVKVGLKLVFTAAFIALVIYIINQLIAAM